MNSCPNCRTANRPVFASLKNNVQREFYRCARCGCDYASQRPAPVVVLQAGRPAPSAATPKLARQTQRRHSEAYYQLSPAKRRQINRLMAIVRRKLETRKKEAA